MDPDVAYLVEEIERAFQVKFDADELADESRLDDVTRALQLRFADLSSDQCLTSIVFWRLRRACVSLFELDRKEISPTSSVDLVLPLKGRRKAWRQLSHSAGLMLPGLEFETGWSTAIFFMTCIPPVALTVALGIKVLEMPRTLMWSLVGVLILGAVILASCLLLVVAPTLWFALLKRFASKLPDHVVSMGDLARAAVALNYGELVTERGSSREREISEALRWVIADATAIQPSAFMTEDPTLLDIVIANDGFRATA